MRSIPLLRPMLLAAVLFGVIANTAAQTELLARFNAEEQEALTKLVLYPEEFRTAILEATLHPEALINMQRLQNRTSEDFRLLVDNYSRQEQALFWDLSRYPELVHWLATIGYQNPNQLSSIFFNEYPEAVQAKAREVLREHPIVLREMDQLLHEANTDFERLLKGYPQYAQENLRKLMELPEALMLLTDHIEMAILLGNSYRNNPVAISQQLDELHLEIARQQAEELADWQENIQNDPQALTDLRSAADEFQEEYGYNDEYYDYKPEERNVVVYYHYHAYPYWFGYPYWYDYPRWRPVPVWYDFGFYYVIDRPIVFVRLPSPFFMRWYFYRPYHHYRYPYLSDRFVHHHTYYGARTYGSSITVSVRHWQRSNRAVITEQWLREDTRRVERFREFGQFETERARVNRLTATHQRSQTEFLAENRNRYPTLRYYQEADQRTRERVQPDKTREAPAMTREKPREQRDRTIFRPRTERQQLPPQTRERIRTERPKIEPRTTPRKQTQTTPKSRTPTTEKQRTTTKRKTTETKKKSGGGR